jgi:hypothetical protein
MIPRVLLLNHQHIKCGVYQFQKRIFDLASKSEKVDFFYRDLANKNDYLDALKLKPDYILYNWHWDRMPWLQIKDITENKESKHYFFWHDGSIFRAYDKYLFFGALDPRGTAIPENKRILLPRPLYNYNGEYPKNNVPTIGSFGFAYHHKRFPELIALVHKTFTRAIINIHMPNPYYGDTPGNRLADILFKCRQQMRNRNIKVNISTNFLSDDELLSFLAKNDINVFNYALQNNPGLSSVFDYALSVKRPIAITNNMMFRHITSNDILLEKHSIKQIMERGTAPLEKFYSEWSTKVFTEKIEELFVEHI